MTVADEEELAGSYKKMGAGRCTGTGLVYQWQDDEKLNARFQHAFSDFVTQNFHKNESPLRGEGSGSVATAPCLARLRVLVGVAPRAIALGPTRCARGIAA